MRPLPDEIRHALLGSPYEAPSAEPGDLPYCAYEGRRVVVAGLIRAVIPWPARLDWKRSAELFPAEVERTVAS